MKEEGWYEEYASYHQGSEGHTESGVLVEPLEGLDDGTSEPSERIFADCPSTHDLCWKEVEKHKVNVEWLTRKSNGCRSGGRRDKKGNCLKGGYVKKTPCTEENVASYVGGSAAAALFPVTTPFAILAGGVVLLECGV